MRTPHAGEHPSNRLSSGGAASFEEALDLVEAQHAYERALMGDPHAEIHGQVHAAVVLARTVYLQEADRMRHRVVDRLLEHKLAAEAALDDEAARWLGLLATALESGDYAGLAI